MPSLRSILLAGLPLAASSFAQLELSSNEGVVAPESRTAAVEQRHSIVEIGRDAIERVVESAREEFGFKRYLRKRQDTNTTLAATTSDVLTSTVSLPLSTSSSSETPVSVSTTFSSVPATTEQPPATSSEAPPSSSSSPSVVEVPSSTSSVVQPTSTSSSAATSASTSSSASSSAAPSSTAVVQPSQTTFAVIASGSVVTSVPSVATVSNGNGQQVTLTSPRPGGVYTNTASNGNVAIVTYTPSGGTVSEVRFLTTTLPNGKQSTITSYATVGAPASPTGESANNGGTSGGDAPKLQSGAAVPSSWYAAEVAVMLGAAVGAAAMLL